MTTLLMNDFYTIQSRQTVTDKSHLQVRIRINRSHPVFAGHFPGHPVIPGVFMIQTITEILSDFLQMELILKELSNVKFLSPIDPAINQDLDIKLEIKAEDPFAYRVNAVILSEEKQFLKCKGRFQKSPDLE